MLPRHLLASSRLGRRPPPPPQRLFRRTFTNLTTLSRKVDFPPTGRRPFFLVSLITFAYAANELMHFSQARERIETLARKAKSGDAFFPPSQVTRALLELNAYALEHEEDKMGPSNVPRILDLGGKEALVTALVSGNENIANAGAELARTVTSSSAAAARELALDTPGFCSALFTALDKSVRANEANNDRMDALDMHNADVHLPNLLSTVANCIEFYPFGRDAHLDNLLLGALESLSKQCANAAERELQHDGSATAFYILQDSAAFNHQAWLLLIALHSTKAGEPFLREYHARFPGNEQVREIFDTEKQQVLFTLARQAYCERRGLPAPPPAALVNDVLSRLLLARNWGRNLLQRLVEREDTLLDLVSALLFGQIWGSVRTLFALRNVAIPTGEHRILWRWKMSTRFGLSAGVGAFALTLLMDAMRKDFGTLKSDSAQMGAFAARILGATFVCGLLFRLCPYFFLPALVADAAWGHSDGLEEGGQYIVDMVPFAKRPRGRGPDVDDGSEWT